MATTTGPVLSISARGTVGKTLTYSAWKGINYVRQRVIPANPKSIAQEANRNLMRWVHDAYKYLPATVQEPWVEYVKGQPMTPANAWQQANQVALKGATDLTNIVFAKPVRSGPPCPSITVTPGTASLTVAAGTPSIITGWTITYMCAIAMKNVAPTGEMEMVISVAGTHTTTPYSVTISGLTTAQAYMCGAFYKYLRPDGLVAFGASLNHAGTPT